MDFLRLMVHINKPKLVQDPQSPPEVDLTIPKVENYSNFQMVPSHGKGGSNCNKVKDLFGIRELGTLPNF